MVVLQTILFLLLIDWVLTMLCTTIEELIDLVDEYQMDERLGKVLVSLYKAIELLELCVLVVILLPIRLTEFLIEKIISSE